MATFAVQPPLGTGTEGEQVKGGVHIIINGIADVFGIEGTTDQPGLIGGLGSTVGSVSTTFGVMPPAPPVVPPDPVQQAMATSDP